MSSVIQTVPDWSDVCLDDGQRLLEVSTGLLVEDLCAVKFLLRDLIDDADLERLAKLDLLRKLREDFHGNALVPEILWIIGKNGVLAKLGLSKDEVGRRLSSCPALRQISPFRQMLQEVSSGIVTRKLEELKMLSESKIKDRSILDAVRCGHGLFNLLEQVHAISDTDVKFLYDILKIVKLNRLALVVKNYETKRGRAAVRTQAAAQPAGAVSVPTHRASMADPSYAPLLSSGVASTHVSNPISASDTETLAASFNSCMSMEANRSSLCSTGGDVEEDSRKVTKQQELEEENQQLREAIADLKSQLDSFQMNIQRTLKGRYDMCHSPKGLCLIINNKTFTKNGEIDRVRVGTNVDRDSLKNIFEKFDFDVKVEPDCSAKRMRDVLQEYRKTDHSDYDCFVVCILSHGKKDHIITSDSQDFAIMDIVETFNANNCPSLCRKPKLFFIQACQGKGGMEPAFGDDIEEDSDTGVPKLSDCVIAQATFPGYSAFRSKTEGSWFISTLCKVLDELHETSSLLHMLIEVNRRVGEAKAGKGEKVFRKQCPMPMFTTRKQIWFHRKDPPHEESVPTEAEG